MRGSGRGWMAFAFVTPLFLWLCDETYNTDRLWISSTGSLDTTLQFLRFSGFCFAPVCLVRVILTHDDGVLTYLASFLIDFTKWPEAEHKNRRERGGVVLFKLLYFLIVTLWGYSILVDASWFHNVKDCWEVLDRNDDELLWYYYLQFAYHLHSLIFTLLIPREDFFEMLVHHLTACILIHFSFVNIMTRIGSLVLFVHDVGDVVGYSIKLIVDSRLKFLVIINYILLLLVWAYSRLYIFPSVILYSIIYDTGSIHIPGLRPFFALLSVLLLLHIYWYYMFIRMGLLFLRTKETVDITDSSKKKVEDQIAKKKK